MISAFQECPLWIQYANSVYLVLDTDGTKDYTVTKIGLFFINLPIPPLDIICDILRSRSVIWNIRPKQT